MIQIKDALENYSSQISQEYIYENKDLFGGLKIVGGSTCQFPCLPFNKDTHPLVLIIRNEEEIFAGLSIDIAGETLKYYLPKTRDARSEHLLKGYRWYCDLVKKINDIGKDSGMKKSIFLLDEDYDMTKSLGSKNSIYYSFISRHLGFEYDSENDQYHKNIQ